MADDSKSLSKLRESADKLRTNLNGLRGKVRDMRKHAEEANKMASKVPAWTLPVGGGVAGYVLGYADAMTSTPEVKTPVTIAIGGASWIGSGVAAYFGQPTIAALSGTTAAVAAGIVTHSAGYNKGQQRAHTGAG
jgi:hypothetical protein